MPTLPAGFQSVVIDIATSLSTVDGFMKPCEIEFLALLAACPTVEGDILEIGCHLGKSTIALAKGASLTSHGKVATVDPLPTEGTPRQFRANLRRAGVSHLVEFHHMTSGELGESWNRPLRLLWIDGDHSYASKTLDFDLFYPFLVDGAIVALHDVLNRFEGPVRTFIERVLLARNFGPVGICGSIGWAQYFADPERCERHRSKKLRLYRRLSRLVPSVAFDNWPTGLRKIQHEFFRSLVQRNDADPRRWLKMVA